MTFVPTKHLNFISHRQMNHQTFKCDSLQSATMRCHRAVFCFVFFKLKCHPFKTYQMTYQTEVIQSNTMFLLISPAKKTTIKNAIFRLCYFKTLICLPKKQMYNQKRISLDH